MRVLGLYFCLGVMETSSKSGLNVWYNFKSNVGLSFFLKKLWDIYETPRIHKDDGMVFVFYEIEEHQISQSTVNLNWTSIRHLYDFLDDMQ